MAEGVEHPPLATVDRTQWVDDSNATACMLCSELHFDMTHRRLV